MISPTRPSRLRVLIIAYDFSPILGSEAALGWNVSTRLARKHDVTVVCATTNQLGTADHREAYAQHVAQNGPIPGLQVVFVDPPHDARKCADLNRRFFSVSDGVGFWPLFYRGLRAWHREARAAIQRMGIDRFDLVHHLTPLAFWGVSCAYDLGIPFFWGPVSGVDEPILSFSRWLGWKNLIREMLRAAVNSAQTKVMRRIRCAAGVASHIWVVTDQDERLFRSWASHRVSRMVEQSGPDGVQGRIREIRSPETLRLCWSGNHTNRKALPLLLEAIAALKTDVCKVELSVLGEGPETLQWRTLANRLCLANVKWHGRLGRPDALRVMDESHVLVHTSLREGTPGVILEALSLGMPVICHDACGMATAINESCGIKVPMVHPHRSVAGFAQALARLIDRPAEVASLSAGALVRAGELSWDAKADEIAAMYETAMGRSEARKGSLAPVLAD